MTTIQIFQKMFDYLIANKLISNQTDLARAAGLNEVSVSRILNGQVKKAKQETLWKVNTAYGNVFNPEWLRGDSDTMLAANVNTTAPAILPDGFPSGQYANPLDYSSLINAALAAKDETIAEKNARIEELCQGISDLRQQVADLRAQLASERGLSTGHPYVTGVADPITPPSTDV